MSTENIDVSTDPLINDPDEDIHSGHNQVPQEIEDFMAENGLVDTKYTCYVRRFSPEGGGEPVYLPWQHKGKYPTASDLGGEFGPGKYLIMFTWKAKDDQGKYQKIVKEFKMVLGDEWEEIALERAAQRMLARQKRLEKMEDTASLRRTIRTGNSTAPKEEKDGVEELRRTANVLRELGAYNNNTPAPAGGADMGMLFQAILAMQQKSSETTMNMMMEQSKQTNQLMIAMMQSNKPQSHSNTFMEVTNLMRDMMDMKSILSPEKKTALDRLFDTLEGSVPMLLQMTAEQRQKSMAPLQGLPQTQEIKNDKAQLQYSVEKMDKAHGQENTNILAGTLGWDLTGLTRFQKEGVPTAEEANEELEEDNFNEEEDNE